MSKTMREHLERDETIGTYTISGKNARPPGGSAVGGVESSLHAVETCM